eukprot:TRINITY_DN17890_c0_g1_i1.p1 TRINITY_DN17890_c0_g1~~TRINITY_DN17890_c0_g1_i1.p1  ORF type:complete len:257 (-),score=3.19 TRINITY_DN17890_c0_g1_i1:365-1090(-)
MTEYEEKLEDQFTPPLSDHDEITRCMECGRKHTTPNGLFWHLDVSHKWSFQLTRLKATTSCPVCNVFCGHWYNMSLHVIEVHGQRNWWKEVDRDIMLIQPAQAQLEEEVTKLDKPIDRRISLILSSSLNRVSRDSFSAKIQQGDQDIDDSIDTLQVNVFTTQSPFLEAQQKDLAVDLGSIIQYIPTKKVQSQHTTQDLVTCNEKKEDQRLRRVSSAIRVPSFRIWEENWQLGIKQRVTQSC